MYIGLKKRTENSDGSVDESFVPFDPSYVNGKIDYKQNGVLEGRVDLTGCTNQDDFASKIQFSNGLNLDDFKTLRCIPAETFYLFKQEGNIKEANSI